MPKPLILCADDADCFLLVWETVLQDSGFRVLIARDGKEALHLFQSHPVDLALLDYHMPQMNGDKAAEQMRACKADIPIALLSADIVPPSALDSVDAFVSKGEPVNRLLEIVNHLLDLRALFQPLPGLGSHSHRKAA